MKKKTTDSKRVINNCVGEIGELFKFTRLRTSQVTRRTRKAPSSEFSNLSLHPDSRLPV